MKNFTSHHRRHEEAPVLITGGAGFIGSNLAVRLAKAGRNVIVLDSLVRPGVELNATELKKLHSAKISVQIADVRDAALAGIAKDVSAIVHFAAQVAVTTSIDRPLDDFDVNLGGTLNLLESARNCRKPPTFLFASTNKVYGNLSDVDLELTSQAYVPADKAIREHGIGERRPLSFHTPYGCSKGAADQYVLDYARTYDIPAAVFRMSCIYGPRQLGTEDQGWVAHFVNNALRDMPITIFGDGRQVRDVMYVDDATEIYARALENPSLVFGRAYNVGGGPTNAISLRELLSYLAEMLGRPTKVEHNDWRAGDQRYYVSDAREIRRALDLAPPTPWRAGIAALASWLAASGEYALHAHHIAAGGAG